MGRFREFKGEMSNSFNHLQSPSRAWTLAIALGPHIDRLIKEQMGVPPRSTLRRITPAGPEHPDYTHLVTYSHDIPGHPTHGTVWGIKAKGAWASGERHGGAFAAEPDWRGHNIEHQEWDPEHYEWHKYLGPAASEHPGRFSGFPEGLTRFEATYRPHGRGHLHESN